MDRGDSWTREPGPRTPKKSVKSAQRLLQHRFEKFNVMVTPLTTQSFYSPAITTTYEDVIMV